MTSYTRRYNILLEVRSQTKKLRDDRQGDFVTRVVEVKTVVNFDHGRVLISRQRSVVKCFRLSKLVETVIPPLHGPSGMAFSDFEKAEAFKDTLEVTFQENAEPYSDDKFEEVENLVNHYFDNLNTLTPPLTSPLEVRGIIKKLPNRKSPGPDQIPNIALKYLPINAITHLTKIYNRCLINCHFPTQWKIANVVMLPKPNQDHKFSQNYRPISLLNTTAKIFVRIILNRIKSHCKAIDYIPPEQCGFREGHSTLHQLIRVTNIINEGFASKLYTVGVFLDVKRAFDKMWHDGPTYKMIKLKFPAYLIKTIYNYLHNRTFRVRVNNTFSETGFCQSGTPQGSVLSPYLYNIFTYDFPDHHTVSTCLFADDSAVLAQGVQLNYTIKTMQRFLDKLENWLTDWRIAVNVEKTQAIVFRKWGVIDPQAELTLFDDNIQWVPVVRYLGLHIDSQLTYKNHIDYLSDKFWGRIALAISLSGRSSPLSLKNKVILYKQILRPTITYGSPIWGAAAPNHTKRIQIIQNKILRIITNAPWYVRNSVIHHDLHMEPIDNYITRTSRNVFTSIQNHDNPVIKAQTLFTYPHSKLNFAYKTTKWNLPLKSP
ncbi:RNA-directed DNA polymerase from mobile element jockey [Trichonephila clavipes]|uniref:RNA-directed DNA polymerase from mobile element jockey n=1 Tax=Trichonephila clavipes TaxID=2585209 RepID=A0A8X6VCR8_TRICX|nr:RNA-directed DNA polymerase from mobile element jockey [Trichonephila clavipes]